MTSNVFLLPPSHLMQIPFRELKRYISAIHVYTWGNGCLCFDCKLIQQGAQIQCVGEGPVVHVTPSHVDYGTIPVLTDISKIVQLSNESLIPAQFSCSMVSQWQNILEMYHFNNSPLMHASNYVLLLSCLICRFVQILCFLLNQPRVSFLLRMPWNLKWQQMWMILSSKALVMFSEWQVNLKMLAHASLWWWLLHQI